MSISWQRINTSWISQNGLDESELLEATSSLVRQQQSTLAQIVINQKHLFLKSYHTHTISGKVKTCFRRCRAIKAYDNAVKLNNLGILCPAPIGVVGIGKFSTVLLTEYLTSGDLLKAIVGQFSNVESDRTKNPERSEVPLFKELGTYLSWIHGLGIYHSDLHDKNIWVQRKPDGFDFFLIDLEAVKFCHRVSEKRIYKNLLRIALNIGTAMVNNPSQGVEFATEFAESYAACSNLAKVEGLIQQAIESCRQGSRR